VLLTYFIVPVLDESIQGDQVTSVRLEPLTVVLIICVVVLSITAAILASFLCRRHHTTSQRHHVVLDDDSSALLRTRLSPLHSNLLCSVTSDDDKLKSGFSPACSESTGGLLAAEGPIGVSSDPLGEICVLDGTVVENLETVDRGKEYLSVEGRTALMAGTLRCRVEKLTQSVSEYEIPLDLHWEFPRDRSV